MKNKLKLVLSMLCLFTLMTVITTDYTEGTCQVCEYFYEDTEE